MVIMTVLVNTVVVAHGLGSTRADDQLALIVTVILVVILAIEMMMMMIMTMTVMTG
jgi:hypothetical protein